MIRKKSTLYLLALILSTIGISQTSFVIEDTAFANKVRTILPESFLGDMRFSAEVVSKYDGELDLKNLSISSINGLEYFKSVSKVDLRYNNLTYADLERITVFDDWQTIFSISPQNKIVAPESFVGYVQNGLNIHLNLNEQINNTQFEWYQNGLLIEKTTYPSLYIVSVNKSDEGNYTCILRNELFPQLVLQSTSIEVTIEGINDDSIVCFDATHLSIESKTRNCETGNSIIIDYNSIVLGNSSLKYMSLLNYHTNNLILRTQSQYFPSLKDSIYKLVIQDNNNCLDTVTIYNDFIPCEDSIECFNSKYFDFLVEEDCNKGNSLYLFEEDVIPGSTDQISFSVLDENFEQVTMVENKYKELKDSIYYIVIQDTNSCTDSFTVFNHFEPCEVCPEINDTETFITWEKDCAKGNKLLIQPSLIYEESSAYVDIKLFYNEDLISSDSIIDSLTNEEYILTSKIDDCIDTFIINNEYASCPEIICFDASKFTPTLETTGCLDGSILNFDSSLITKGTYPVEITVWDGDITLNSYDHVTTPVVTIEISDGHECRKVYEVTNDYEPCEDNIIIANDELHNSFYIDEAGNTKVYNSNGALIKSFDSPGYWYGDNQDNELVPMGEYYLITNSSKAVSVSVFR